MKKANNSKHCYFRVALLAAIFAVTFLGCTESRRVEGPDKQGSGLVKGAVTGAGTGAVTGFQLGAATGPSALVGAGLGAVAGSIQGMAIDREEEHMLRLSAATQRERERAVAQEVLADHYKRRMELHPTRDIFPADLFFYADKSDLRPSAIPLVREIADLNRSHYPWSRFAIAMYVRSDNDDSPYAIHLAKKRAQEISDRLIKFGIEPRRIESRAVITRAPVLIDPNDNPGRYNQAVEFIAVDN